MKCTSPCPLIDLGQEGELPSGTLKQKWALKETPRTALQSPLSLMWRHGWNGRPISWAHLLGGHSRHKEPPKLAWKIRASFYILRLEWELYWSLGTLCPLLRGVSIEMPSCQTTYPTKMCSKIRPTWWLLMPGVSNIGQRNKVCQEVGTSILWQKASWSYVRP